MDAFLRRFYSKHLTAAHEPAVRSSSAREAYRFIHLPSFSHPVMIRLEDNRGRRMIVVKELDGAGGYESGPLLVERHRELTAAEWRRIQNELAGMRYWAMPKHPCATRSHADDGFGWILEGKLNEEYTVVQWHWDECLACLYFVQLAEIELQGIAPPDSAFPFDPTPTVPPPPEF